MPGLRRAAGRPGGGLPALLLTVALVVALPLAGCAEAQPELPAPAAALQSLLELRLARSRDTTAYARYFEATAVASALADDAAKNEKPIPAWETPKVEDSGVATATVVVVWKPSKDFKDWPTSTAFVMKKIDGRWVVVDATEARSLESTSGSSGPNGAP